MKTRRTLYRLALLSGLGLALMAAPGQEKTAAAGVCPNGVPSCTSPLNCLSYCGPNTARGCNLSHCCICGT